MNEKEEQKQLFLKIDDLLDDVASWLRDRDCGGDSFYFDSRINEVREKLRQYID